MNAEAIAALLRTHLAEQFGWMGDGLRGEIARKVAPLLADDLAALFGNAPHPFKAGDQVVLRSGKRVMSTDEPWTVLATDGYRVRLDVPGNDLMWCFDTLELRHAPPPVVDIGPRGFI